MPGSRGSRGGSSGSSSPRRSFSTSSANRGSSSSTSVPPQQTRQPGLFKQMAATAGGVAAGHVVGSAIVGGLRGNGSQGGSECVDCQRPPNQQDPCETELRNFMICSQREADISSCDGFNTLLKECRRFYDSKEQK